MERRRSSLPRSKTFAGFSLIELMVALALSLLLLLGVVAIFSSSRVAYESTDQLSRIQETGRFALDEIARRVRVAGFAGCARQPNFMSSALASSGVLEFNFLGGAVQGTDGAAEGQSDVLAVRGPRMDFQPVRVAADMVDPQLPLVVDSTDGFAVNDVVVASSCEGRSFFQVTSVGPDSLGHATQPATATTAGNAFASTNYPFREGAEVVPVETVVYFVGPSPQPPAPPAPAPEPAPSDATSLWRRIGFGAAEELVPGVQQMQVKYGVDADGDRVVDRYDDATDVTNWDRVLAVRVALLVRSVDQYGTDIDQRTYQLLDEDTTVVAPGDRRLREVFTSTTSIRNRTRTD